MRGLPLGGGPASAGPFCRNPEAPLGWVCLEGETTRMSAAWTTPSPRILTGLLCVMVMACSEVEPDTLAAEKEPASETSVLEVDPPEPSGEATLLGGMRLEASHSDTLDLGLVREGESRVSFFEFVSDGEGPLVIEEVKPSCGCTVPAILVYDEDEELVPYEMGDPIPTGSRFRLLTRVFTQGKQGNLGLRVPIKTNAPDSPFTVLLRVEVEPVLRISPDRRIDLGRLSTTDAEERMVRVKSRRGERFLLTTQWLPTGVQIELDPFEPDEDGRSDLWDLTMTAGPGLPVGDRAYSCQLFTDLEVADPEEPNADGSPQYHRAILILETTGFVQAQPTFVGLGRFSPGEVVERTVRIESQDDFRLTSDLPIELEGSGGGPFPHVDYISTVLEAFEGGAYAELRIRVKVPDAATGAVTGALKIKLDHPEQKELAIRFSGFCQAES